MKFISAALLTLLLNYLLCLFLPWWSIAPGAAAVAVFIRHRTGRSFLAAFLGGFLHWFIIAFFIDIANNHILSARIAGLFSLPQPFMMIILTAFIGGIISGLSAFTVSTLLHGPGAKVHTA